MPQRSRRTSPAYPTPVQDLGTCPICGRPMVPGPSADRHHWVPASLKGRDWSWIHRICHRKIHTLWNEKELAANWNRPEAIRSHPEMERFVTWVARRPPEFMDGHARPARRR